MSSSTIDTTTSSLDVGSVAKLAFILGFSTADVEVGGSSHVTATSKLDMQATSTVKIVADMTADSGKADNNTDAAVATIGITTNTYARITGNAVVNTTGALLNVSAKSSSTGIAIGDGTSGGAGATVGAAVITGETVAAVNDHAQITDASGVSITADRLNDATAVAKSTTKGSTDGDSSQESKKQLSGNDAQTGGGNSVSFAGAVAVSTVVSHSSAYLDTAGSVQSSGSLAVISTSATNSQARADGSATVADHDSNAANNTNVGIAVGIGVGDLHNDAYIKGESNTITANGVSIKATMGSHDRTLDFASGGVDASTGKITLLGGAAIAGASGGATSVAGALVINVGISHTNAYIADGTTVTVTGSGTVEIKAENFIEVTSKGTGKQTNGGSTGVGPVFSLNIGETDTNALLGDATLAPASAASVSGAGAVTISAASKNAMDNEAEGGAKSDKTAVTPVVAISVASNTTNANADAATSALNAGSLNVTASHEGSNNVSATGNTESGKTGVGISFALAITTDSAIATTARDVVASGAVAFNAKTASGTKSKAKSSVAGGDSNDSDKNDPNGGVNKKAADNKQFASDRATAKGGKSAGNTDGSSAEASGEDGSSKKVEVAGAVGITVANTTARASIPDGLTITAGNGTGITNGTLTVKSENNTDAQAVADGSVTNPGTTFDPTVSNATDKGYVDFSADNINLGTDTGLHTGDQIYYRANGGTAIGGLENGKTYFVRDIGSGKFELYDTKDHANDTLHTAGRRDLLKDTTHPAPTGTTQSLDPVDAEAAGTGVGIAVAVNVARVTNEALVGNSDITADGLIVQALVPQVGSSDKVDSFSAEATAGVSGIDTGIAGALAVNVGMSHSKAAIANSATVTITDGGDVALTAENFVANSTKASGKQEAGGKTGVGAAIGVNIGMTDTTAHVGDGASISGAKDIKLSASSTNELSNSADAGSKGKTAVTPSIAVSVSNNDTEATLGTYSLTTNHNTGKVELTASHEGSVSSEASGDTESGDTGVGISLALTISTDKSLATTNRDIDAGDAVTFSAKTISADRSRAKASVAGAGDEDQNNKSTDQGGSGGKSVDQKVTGQKDTASNKATTADSGAAGKTGDTSNASASTSSGDSSSGSSVSVAGAVAVTVTSSTSSAVLGVGRTVTTHHSGNTGVLSLLSQNLTESTAFADGGSTVSGGGTSVGVGVSVNVANVTNEAYVAGGATVNADGVSAKATMASRDVKFTVDHIDVIDTGKSTIFVGLDSGLKTGDKRTYDKGVNTNNPIDGLTSGNDYYVRVLDGGKIQLYEASDDAQHPDSAAKSGDETKLVHLTGTGSGTGHKLKWAFDAGNPLSLPGSDVSFDPSTQLRVIDLAEGSQLDTGDAVHYDNGGGSTMGGLNTTDTFYVIQLDDKHSQLAGSRQHALDGTAVKLNDDGNTTQTLVDSTDTFRAQARSGAGGGKIGVAGSVAINIAQVHTRGMIGYGGSGAASVTLVGGDVDLEAQSRTDNFVDASPTSSAHGAGGSSVGVGASFGLNVVLEDTTAGIADGQSVTGSAGQFTIKADNQNTAVTVAENGASGGGTQVGAAVAIAVVDISTTAKAGADQGGSVTTLTLSGALEVEAIHSDTVYTTTKGEAAGDGTAVGASVSLNIVTDDTIATVARSFTGGTLVTVASTSRMDTRAEARGSASGASSTKDGTNDTSDSNKSRDSQQETNHQADFATQKSGTSGKPSGSAQSDGISQGDSNSSSQSGNSSQGGTSVAASVAVNYMNVHNTARITGAGVSVTGTDHAKITADSDADAAAQGLSTATNTKADTGVAAAVGVNIALVHNTAKVDDNVTLQAKDVAIKAEMMSGEKNTFVARALSGGVAKNTAVGGSVALNYIDVETTASIGANAHVSSTSGDIDVAAESRNEIQNVSGGAALSTSNGTGVGVAVSINILNKLDTEANVGHDAVVTATGGSVHITSNASLEPKTETLPIIGDVKITSFAAGVAASSGGAAIGGSSSIDVYFVDTHAFVEHDAHITADQGVTVSAQDAITVFSAAGGIGASSGSAGVGIGLDVGVIVRHTTAHVDEGAQVTANNGDITVHAQSDDDITSIAATFGLSSSSAGVAASVGVMVLITETRAYTEEKGSGSAVQLTATHGNVSLTAQGDMKALMIAGAIGGGSSAGVGVANTTLVHNDTVAARMGAQSAVN